MLNEHIDRHIVAEIAEPVLMFKAWIYCLSRSHGNEIGLTILNQVGPHVEDDRLQRAWASLVGFNGEQLNEHALRRLVNSLENALGRSPVLTGQLLDYLTEVPQFQSIHQLISQE
jgi:hypothetical protein